MFQRKAELLLFLLLAFFAVMLFSRSALAADVPRMTKEKLKTLLGNENVIIIDVRTGRDWHNSGYKIKGAVREEPGDFSSWSDKYPKDKTLVLYCA